MRIFGIRIGVSPFWFLLLFLLIFSLDDYYKNLYPGADNKAFILAVVAGLLFPASILAHELGHMLAARREGIEIGDIELFLLGGLARMSPARTAGAEFRVAAAGPAVSLLLLIICLALGATVLDWGNFRAAMQYEVRPNMGEAEAVLGYITWINAIMFVFNLLPGLPLDGGRMGLAIAWWRTGDRQRATRLMARTGRGAAYILGGLGLWALVSHDTLGGFGGTTTGVWLIFIALFMYQAARAEELWSARVVAQLDGLRVVDIMDAEPVAVSNGTKLDRALDDFFLRYRWPWFPVTDPQGRFVGLVTLDKIEAVPVALRPGSTVDEVMARDADPFRVTLDRPLESLLAEEGLHRLGALMAVDGDGVLRGVITLDMVRRALRPATPTVDTTA
jgi:Zn-dependent protease